MALGVSGIASIGDIAHAYIAPRPPAPTDDPKTWLVRRFLPSIRRLCKKHKIPVHQPDGTLSYSFIVALNGAAYVVDSDGSVSRSMYGYVASGSGYEVALGALAATDRWSPKRRAVEAVRAACRHVTDVAEPVHYAFLEK